MAEMIPRTLDPSVEKNPYKSAEVAIFKDIQKDENLQDWICLHSLNLETDRASLCGEIDFVLVGPSGVYCLETKGGSIRCEDGSWHSTDRNGVEHEIKNPYVQVKDATYVVRKEIEKKLKDMKNKIIFGHIVAFPHCVVPKSSIECNPTLTYDITDRDMPISIFLNRVRAYFETKIGQKGVVLTPEIREKIKNILRPDFEIFEPLAFILNKIEEEIESLTSEQYRVMDGLAINPRIMVKGQAGTGKTLLARYHARHLAREGKRVLFLCFNILLAESLKAEVKRENLDEMIHVDRVFNYFHSVIEPSRFIAEYESKYDAMQKSKQSDLIMTDLLPGYFTKTIKDLGDKFKKYDYLIIDEAQDILCDPVMTALGFALKGGLKKGSWCMFYDPDIQTELYNYYDKDYCGTLIQECAPIQYYLTVNCRNTREIVEETSTITGFDMARVSSISGEKVKYFFYRDNKDLQDSLASYIEELLKQGVKHEDINVLFPGGYKGIEHALRDLPGITTQLLTEQNLNSAMPKTILTCSIQKYKGLENKVIIIAGLEHVGNVSDRNKAVYCVGMTRAKALLTIFASMKIRDAIEQIHVQIKPKETFA